MNTAEIPSPITRGSGTSATGRESALTLTRHARERLRQRGLCDKDIELVLECGTDGSYGRVALLGCDVAREVAECKRRIQTLERLRDWVVVCEGGIVVTCYNAAGQARHRMLGNSDQRRRRTKPPTGKPTPYPEFGNTAKRRHCSRRAP